MSWWNPFSWVNKPPQTTPPVVAPKPTTSGFVPFVLPYRVRLTYYGYPSDTTPDRNSANAIGAWNNHLVDKLSFAVSPDVEQVLHDHGIQHNDMVTFLLLNGVKLRRQWADRTDPSLKGRVDLYSLSGLDPKLDGVAVLAFRIE